MSRSVKKAFATISKVWNKSKEHAFRHRIKRALHEVEIDFNPDDDFEELTMKHKKLREWGTKLGFDIPPDENDSTRIHEEYDNLRRK